jgi:hypothetical protein
MPIYNVTLPIAGHAFAEVEADDEDAAIEAAFEVVTRNDIEEWGAAVAFNRAAATADRKRDKEVAR